LSPQPPRVLVAEDDPDTRETLAEILRLAGFEVAPAANGEEALSVLMRPPAPDVVVLDVSMPSVDGPTFLAARSGISEAVARIPVVIVSGEQQRAFGLKGVSAVFEKPFDVDAFVARIRALCPKP
jgi:DNA-binding response OmpR family regulator